MVKEEVKGPGDWTKILHERFEVKRSAFVGKGGFAVVRRARDLQGKCPVAVKFYAADGGDGCDGMVGSSSRTPGASERPAESARRCFKQWFGKKIKLERFLRRTLHHSLISGATQK